MSWGTALVLVTYVTPMVSVPATAADLDVGPVGRAWVLSSMSVGLAAVLLAAGVLGDSLGRRRAYVLGLAAMGLGSLGCAAAPSVGVFVAARLVEGAGGAAVLACGLALLTEAYPAGRERAHATAVWGASVALGISVGALLAAALDVGTRWRETYGVVGLVALVLVPATTRWVAPTRPVVSRRIDLPGLVLLSAALTLLVSALTQGRSGVTGPTLMIGGAAVLLLVVFGWVETRVSSPLVEPALFREPRFLGATIGAMVLVIGMVGTTSFVPTLVQSGLGHGLWAGSLLITCWSGASVVASLALRLVHRPLTGPGPLAACLAVVTAGLCLALGLQSDSSPWRIAPAMVLCGLATGILNALLGREAVASVPAARAAMGSGANQTARYLGAACGITAFVVVATHTGSGEGPAALVSGWNVAVVVALSATAVGSLALAVLALVERARRADSLPATDSTRSHNRQ